MSDYNSSLPVRTQTAGDVIIKVADATVTSQQLKVNSDGTVDLGSTTLAALESITVQNPSGASAVNIQDGGNSITVDGTVDLGATTLAALESITVQNPAGASAVNIQDGGNSITVDGTVELGVTTLAALESITVQNPAGASAVNIQDGGNSITVDATALDIRSLTHVSDSVKIGDGVDLLAVNTDGSINVVLLSDVQGTEICNYTTSSAVATAASVNHDYTVTALKTFTTEEVVVAGSGKIKVQVLFNAVVKFTAFNSTSYPTIIIPILRLMKATAGQVVRITITNLDNQAQDVYSTLLGEETP